MSLQTPTMIRILQGKLYRKAKARTLLHRGRLRPELFFSVCLAMKPVGEPDAGDRHVRFDERDGKRSVAEWPKLPRPSSTLPHGLPVNTAAGVAPWRCQFWEDCTTNISECEFPTGTAWIEC